MRYLICLFVLQLCSLGRAQEMIKDITEPVTTDFGVYNPVTAEFIPQAIPYTVNSDFSNVANYLKFED